MPNESSGQFEQLKEINWSAIDESADAQSYPNYLARIGNSRFFLNHQRLFLAALPHENGQTILDAGCGIGAHSRAIAKMLDTSSTVLGIDKSRKMIEAAKLIPSEESAASLEFEMGDIGALRFSDETIDGIICERVLIHLENPREVIAELRRVLKPNGWLALTEPDWSRLTLDPSSDQIQLLCQAHEAAFRNGSIGSELDRLLVESGFSIHYDKEHTYQGNDFASDWNLTNLPRTLSSLVSQGKLTQEEADLTVAFLEQAGSENRFRLSLSWNICVGRKESQS